MDINWIMVDSSAIKRVAFDEETGRMWVQFNNNLKIYYHINVTKELFNEFLNAESIGRFWIYTFKNNKLYRATLIEGF